MQIISFPSHYQLVYISFDISSFSVISYAMKWHESQNVLTLITKQSNRKDITTSFIPSNTLAAYTLSTKGEHTYVQPNSPHFSIVLYMWQHLK